MNYHRPLLLSVILLSLMLMSFSWPMKQPRITSTFGESRGDHFHDGIDVTGKGVLIYPVAPGKLIYYRDMGLFPFDTQYGGGNMSVLGHDNGMMSVYMHLEQVSVKEEFDSTSVLGHMGNTGHSYGNHLHFTLVDGKSRDSVNPLGMLSSFPDDKSPEIGRGGLRIGDRLVYIRDKASIRLTQPYPFLIEISDQALGGERLGVYRLRVVMNGKEIHDVTFSRIEMKDGIFLVKGSPFGKLFDRDGLYLVPRTEWKQGENSILVTAWDLSGNRTHKKFIYTVTMDKQ